MAMSLAASSGAIGQPLVFGGVNGYFGQSGQDGLRNYCAQPGIEYVSLAFVNEAPEHNPSGLPGDNFGAHCWANVYDGKNGVPSHLYSMCQSLKEDIPYCKERGVKVLLSIGGVYDKVKSNYEVSTEANGDSFADFLYGAFGPKKASWDGPRPFDNEATGTTTSVDGFDFDIELALDNKPYIAMIDTFRSLDSNIIITGAPECPTSDNYFYMKDMIKEAKFDALFIQFYNNPGCEYTSGFNFNDWAKILDNSNKSKQAKIYVGIPGNAVNAAGSGYIAPAAVKELICKYHNSPHWGGISIWDLWYAGQNKINGKDYTSHVLEALESGCGSAPTTTTTSRASTKTTSTKTTSTKTTSIKSSTTSKATATSTKSSTSSVIPGVTSTSAASSSDAAVTTSFPTLTHSHLWNTTSTSPQLTTSVVYTTSVHTVTKCPPYVTDCPVGPHVTTETIPLYTTICPVTATEKNSHPVTTASASKTTVSSFPTLAPTHYWNHTSSVQLTTSVVYTTSVHTVTKCPPYVTDCPVGPHVTTETIPLYTTICPVTATQTGGQGNGNGNGNGNGAAPTYTTLVSQPTQGGNGGSGSGSGSNPGSGSGSNPGSGSGSNPGSGSGSNPGSGSGAGAPSGSFPTPTQSWSKPSGSVAPTTTPVAGAGKAMAGVAGVVFAAILAL